MKKILLSVIAIYISILGVFAQSLSISMPDGTPLNNGDTVTYTVIPDDYTFDETLLVTNNSNSSLNVVAKKVELFVVPGTEIYFCWDMCFPPNVFVSGDVVIDPGETSSNFIGEYDSKGIAGKSRAMYVFYDENNSSDSSWIILEYHTGSQTNVKNIADDVELAEIYPNPAGNIAYFDYKINKMYEAKFVISNIVGSITHSQLLNSTDGKLTLDLSDYENGIYFYSLVIDGETILTKKLVIKN